MNRFLVQLRLASLFAFSLLLLLSLLFIFSQTASATSPLDSYSGATCRGTDYDGTGGKWSETSFISAIDSAIGNTTWRDDSRSIAIVKNNITGSARQYRLYSTEFGRMVFSAPTDTSLIITPTAPLYGLSVDLRTTTNAWQVRYNATGVTTAFIYDTTDVLTGGGIAYPLIDGTTDTQVTSGSCIAYAHNIGYTPDWDAHFGTTNRIEGIETWSGSPLPTPTPPTTDVTYIPKISITGTFQNFTARATGIDTDPVTSGLYSTPDLIWSLVDTSDFCDFGDSRPICTFASLGYPPVCDSVSIPFSSTFNWSDHCDGYTFLSDHTYAITAGYTYGIGNDNTTYPSINLVFKTVMYDLPDKASYSLDSTFCTTTLPEGDYGVGRHCIGVETVDCSTYLPDIFSATLCALNEELGGTGDVSNGITDFTTDTHGLTAIIVAPLTAVNSLTSATCTPITIPFPFTSASITMPCFYDIYEDNLGAVFVIYQTIISGVISYYVIVGLLAIVKGFKDPEDNKIEVLKL